MSDDRKERLVAIRRPPPPFEPVSLVERHELSPRMWRLTFEGDCLHRMRVEQPGTSVRFVVPWPGAELELPDWNGNEFLLSDGTRPALRTFTPLRPDSARGRLDLEIVRHPGGAVSGWAETAPLRSLAAVSGPGAGFEFSTDAERLLVLGDETAMPAIGQLVDMAPDHLALEIHVEVARDDAVLDLRPRPQDTIQWHVTADGEHPGGRIASVVESMRDLAAGTDLWAAGEASAMQRIRNHVFKTIGADRSRAAVRGYWKPAH